MCWIAKKINPTSAQKVGHQQIGNYFKTAPDENN